jgi:low affinity Fe/Cu permease
MPAAAQRRRADWIGLDSVTEERGLKMGGWYATITDAGSESASSATRVVKLLSIG